MCDRPGQSLLLLSLTEHLGHLLDLVLVQNAVLVQVELREPRSAGRATAPPSSTCRPRSCRLPSAASELFRGAGAEAAAARRPAAVAVELRGAVRTPGAPRGRRRRCMRRRSRSAAPSCPPATPRRPAGTRAGRCRSRPSASAPPRSFTESFTPSGMSSSNRSGFFGLFQCALWNGSRWNPR